MALSALAASALISAIPAVLQMGIGGAQLMKGNRMNPVRPDFNIPESSRSALSNAEYMASQTELPGAEAIKSNIQESGANAVEQAARYASNPNAVLGMVNRVQENQNDQFQQLGIQGANFFANNQNQLRSQQNNMAQLELTRDTWDKYNPYMEEILRKQALIGSGLENIMGASKSASTLGTNFLGAKTPIV